MAITALLLILSLFGTTVFSESKKLETDELDSILSTVPDMPTSGTWPHEVAFGRVDTLKRGSQKQYFGRWALSVEDACSGINSYSSIPTEEKWDGDVITHSCPDEEFVLEVHLVGSTSVIRSKKPKDYIKLLCGVGGACDGNTTNQRAKNTHGEKVIKATFEWRSQLGIFRTTSKKLEPGQTGTITYCNCGDVKVVGARYVD